MNTRFARAVYQVLVFAATVYVIVLFAGTSPQVLAAGTLSEPGYVEGYGIGVTGGQGGATCTVTNPSSTGAGSFSDCARRGNVNVVFSGPGPYTVDGQATYIKSNTTIDGCANGQNGVTLSQPSDINRQITLEGPASNVIVRCIRFQGKLKSAAGTNEHDLLSFDGTGGAISRVFIDRSTFTEATDGALDLVGNVTDVTVQRSLFYMNPLTMLIKYNSRARISIHHNVLTYNCERNPQIKGDINGFDFVSNVVGPDNTSMVDYENGVAWQDCYGFRAWAGNSGSDSPGNPKGNAISNVIFGQIPFDLRVDSGASLGGVYLSGNQCNGGGCAASPGSSAFPIPAANAITVTPVGGLKATLGLIGAPNRTAADQSAIDRVSAMMSGSSATPTPTPSSTTSPIPSVTPTPTTTVLPGSLREGDMISAAGSADPDIYIINEFGYKRLFLNPAIFSFYGHLGGFQSVKSVSPQVRDAFGTTLLFRNCESGDQKVYAIEIVGEDTAVLHHVNMTGNQAVAEDPNFFKKVFCVNNNEYNWYPQSVTPYTSLSQIPPYIRS